jgi:saccharopine dehydrogenase-like NADP-dependent oxidoreductase
MKRILLFGSGRSAPVLIQYLSEWAENGGLTLTIADSTVDSNLSSSSVKFVATDVKNEPERRKLIENSDLVISLLPPSLHFLIAQDCLLHSKHFITASYVSPELKSLDQEAKYKGLLFLMECGLDPGIDHLSAMKEIEDIKEKGGTITSFKSYTGGLIAPESDDNPWNYKITWNPRNVVLAGQGTSKYLENGEYKYLPYHRLFTQTETIRIENFGNFEGYANRDSLHYINTYGLQNISTFLRGTLRPPGFCSAWNLLVQLGVTDDSYIIENSENLSWYDFTLSFLKNKKDKKINHLLAALINKGPGAQEIHKLKWLGLLSKEKTGLHNATPAQLVQKLLEEKLVMKPDDKDMIVMHHLFEYTLDNKNYKRSSSLVLKGENKINTAMAKTVGLPLGIAARLILENKLKLTGVQIPVVKALYEPMFMELKNHGIEFKILNYEL